MCENLNKMYEFLEALNMDGSSESANEKKARSDTRDERIDLSSCQAQKKCDDQCVDCFLTFCQK